MKLAAIMLQIRYFKRSIVALKEYLRLKVAVKCNRGDRRVIVGSASMKQAGWISTDYPLLDLTDDRTFSTLFAADSISNFLAEHVWEHLSPEDGAKACRNCFVFLKKGGVLRIAVPDGLHPDTDYIAQVKPGGYGSGADDHKVLYTYQTLSTELKSAGYQIKLLEWFDEQGNFHYEEWDIRDGMIQRSISI